MSIPSFVRRMTLAATCALALVISTPGAGPAVATTPPDTLQYAGLSLGGARVPAQQVTFDFISGTTARSVEFLLDGRSVSTDTVLDQRGASWMASATVDLHGKQGSSQLLVKVTGQRSFRAFWKYFTVLPLQDTPAARLSGAAAAGAGTTGVPAGTLLTPSGPLTITEPGRVVSGLDIDGCVVVAADDVVIRNSRITCRASSRNRVLTTAWPVKNLLVEDSEINGAGSVDIGVDVSNAVLRRLNIHSVTDGVRMGSNLSLEDSWVHGLVRRGSLHPDAVQAISSQRVRISGNTLDPRSSDRRDLGNASIMIGSESGTMLSRDVVIRDNFMDGGNFAVNVSGAIWAQGIDISDNLFGTASRYGAVITPQSVPLGAGNLIGAARLRVSSSLAV